MVVYGCIRCGNRLRDVANIFFEDDFLLVGLKFKIYYDIGCDDISDCLKCCEILVCLNLIKGIYRRRGRPKRR